MAFGLGAGACFYYVALDEPRRAAGSHGRTARLEENFLRADRRGAASCAPSPRPDGVLGGGREAEVDAGSPVLLLTDLYYLDHYGNSAHFPGHAVVLAGYDEELA